MSTSNSPSLPSSLCDWRTQQLLNASSSPEAGSVDTKGRAATPSDSVCPESHMVAIVRYPVHVIATAFTFLRVPFALCITFIVSYYVFVAILHTVVGHAGGTVVTFLEDSARNARGVMDILVTFGQDTKDVIEHLLDTSALSSRGVLCALPLLALCDAGGGATSTPLAFSDYPSLMDVQNRAFDDLLGQSGIGMSVSLDVKRVELAIRDLIAIVKASDLGNRELIASALDDFVIDSRIAGRALQKLSVKMYSSMDNLIALNGHTLRMLGAATTSDVSLVLLHTFQSSAGIFADEISRIMLEAAKATAALDLLEEQLYRIQAAAVHDDILTTVEIDNVLAELWTKLGGNGQRLRDLERRAAVLKSLNGYRHLAVAHVAATVQTLIGVEEELAQLTEKLRSTERSVKSDIPVEVQIASIDGAVRRLRDERMRARSGDLGSLALEAGGLRAL